MTEKEVLLAQLQEYGTALERFQTDEHQRARAASGARTRQLFHLERRMLQLQTQLSALDLMARSPATRGQSAEEAESIWSTLNPWRPEFQMGAYVAVLAILMLAASILPILCG